MKPSSRPRGINSARRPKAIGGPFVCSWSAVGDCAVFRVAGAIDSGTLPTFDAELRHVITTKLPRVVVDLRRITAMESAGLDVLADAHDLALEHGGWLRASGAGQWLADLIRSTRAARPLDHYPTLPDALPAYRRSQVAVRHHPIG